MAIQPGSRGLGLLKQVDDPHDLKLSAILTPTTMLPLKVDHAPWIREGVRNQGSVNNCQSEALIRVADIQFVKEGHPSIVASANFTYYMARAKDTGNKVSGDNGATARSAALSVQNEGRCPMGFWPDGTATVAMDPRAFWHNTHPSWVPPTQPGVLVTNIGNYTIAKDPMFVAKHHQAVTIRTVEATSLAGRQCIAAGFTFELGIPAKQSLYDVGAPWGIMAVPTDAEQLYGYHSIVAFGYDDTMYVDGHRGFFHVINSWGTEWGAQGYGWMPYDWFDTTNIAIKPFDCWTVHFTK